MSLEEKLADTIQFIDDIDNGFIDCDQGYYYMMTIYKEQLEEEIEQSMYENQDEYGNYYEDYIIDPIELFDIYLGTRKSGSKY